METIVRVFDRINVRWFLVKYVGYDEPEWNREHLFLWDGYRDFIRNFWEKSGKPSTQEFYEIESHKYEICAREYKRVQDLLKTCVQDAGKHHYHQFVKASDKAKTEVIKIKKEITQERLTTAKWGKTPTANC